MRLEGVKSGNFYFISKGNDKDEYLFMGLMKRVGTMVPRNITGRSKNR